MNKNVKLLLVVGSILIILTVLFFELGNYRDEKYEQEKAMGLQNTANDDEVAFWNEAERYERINRRQQLGIVIAGVVIVLADVVGWVLQRKQEPER